MESFIKALNSADKHGADMSNSNFAISLGYADDYGHGLIFNTKDFSDIQERLDNCFSEDDEQD